MNALSKNWITTLAGVLIILGTVAEAVVTSDNVAGILANIQANWDKILFALGLFAAKDAVKLVNKPDAEK